MSWPTGVWAIRETGKAKAPVGLLPGRTPAKRACRSLKLAAFAAFASPLDLLTRFAGRSERVARIRGP